MWASILQGVKPNREDKSETEESDSGRHYVIKWQKRDYRKEFCSCNASPHQIQIRLKPNNDYINPKPAFGVNGLQSEASILKAVHTVTH